MDKRFLYLLMPFVVMAALVKGKEEVIDYDDIGTCVLDLPCLSEEREEAIICEEILSKEGIKYLLTFFSKAYSKHFETLEDVYEYVCSQSKPDEIKVQFSRLKKEEY
ncbi:uncharacterized protein [Parasteatoda tepidariorum]|uniref:uncharacterized protein n=1 Tax=Parasteatoda tepidariorum TaxID=114398 RepID=UPI001C71DE69|nr:uncharacterized protein LOC107456858 [Parasteatoda tepidariorum]